MFEKAEWFHKMIGRDCTFHAPDEMKHVKVIGVDFKRKLVGVFEKSSGQTLWVLPDLLSDCVEAAEAEA